MSTYMDLNLNILNIYGPYVDRNPFWDSLDDFISLKKNFLIVNDLNMTLSLKEVLVSLPRQDYLRDYFSHFSKKNMFDRCRAYKISARLEE